MTTSHPGRSRAAPDIDLFGSTVLAPETRRAGMGSHQGVGRATDEWITPREVIRTLGTFDLDPCSPGVRRPWDTARRHLSVEDDGLSATWAGRVWLNPPYSEAGPWLRRLALHGHGTALIFARTETTAWFDHVWSCATGLLFLRGRLTFHHVDGRLSSFNAGAPSVLVAYGSRDADVLASAPLPGRYVSLVA